MAIALLPGIIIRSERSRVAVVILANKVITVFDQTPGAKAAAQRRVAPIDARVNNANARAVAEVAKLVKLVDLDHLMRWEDIGSAAGVGSQGTDVEDLAWVRGRRHGLDGPDMSDPELWESFHAAAQGVGGGGEAALDLEGDGVEDAGAVGEALRDLVDAGLGTKGVEVAFGGLGTLA